MPYPGKNKEEIIAAVMHKYKSGELHAGDKQHKAESRKQALAIALSESRKYSKK